MLIVAGHQRDANQNHIEIPSHASERQLLKNMEITDARENVEK